MNPYGQDAFFTKDSGGFLFDLPYAPTEIVGVLGACKSIMAQSRICVSEHNIAPEKYYDEFLAQVTDPEDANYWDVVFDMPRTQRVRMEAPDQCYSIYEMVNGAVGACHIGRIYHPVLPGSGGGSLQIFGSEGNLLFGCGYSASIVSRRKDLLPRVEADGWYHQPLRGDFSKAKWPKPVPGAFNYYHESTQHFIDCILHNRQPIIDAAWGLHITEMLTGAEESSRTGKRYEMTTTLV
jgi:predicted dehydrogenase